MRKMRRRDREVTDMNEILHILDTSKVAHIGLIEDGMPYVVPMNYGYTFEGDKLIIYTHGALDGRKLDVIKNNPNCCAQMDCDIVPFEGAYACAYGCSYYSLMGFGKITVVDDVEEKQKALSILMKVQTGKDFEFTERLTTIVSVFRLECDYYTAKYRPMPEMV